MIKSAVNQKEKGDGENELSVIKSKNNQVLFINFI